MVSVIIPAYNPGKYIMDAFSSAVIQDVKKEIIIVDDHSGEAWIDDFLSKVKWKYDVSEEKTSIGGLNEKAIVFKWAGIVCDK
ncbi:MAG: glycosyltransferase, partial [Lachnospiraceae bacterium]|nr:glycosyltransferase [Lachnospiraceae bacterium]